MGRYIVKRIVCDYAVVGTTGTLCICNCRSNAEYIADIMNADSSEQTAYTYNSYASRKYDINEHVVGHWIEHISDTGNIHHLECSVCHNWQRDLVKDKHCPNCGTEMANAW